MQRNELRIRETSWQENRIPSYSRKTWQSWLVTSWPNVQNYKRIQECLPVGCVPSAAVAVCWGVSASVLAGIPPPGVGLETLLRPGCGLGDPHGCGPGDLQGMLGYHPPPRRPARHAGIPPAMHAGIPPPPHPPPCEQNSWHTLLKILPCPKLRLRAVIRIIDKSIIIIIIAEEVVKFSYLPTSTNFESRCSFHILNLYESGNRSIHFTSIKISLRISVLELQLWESGKQQTIKKNLGLLFLSSHLQNTPQDPT